MVACLTHQIMVGKSSDRRREGDRVQGERCRRPVVERFQPCRDEGVADPEPGEGEDLGHRPAEYQVLVSPHQRPVVDIRELDVGVVEEEHPVHPLEDLLDRVRRNRVSGGVVRRTEESQFCIPRGLDEGCYVDREVLTAGYLHNPGTVCRGRKPVEGEGRGRDDHRLPRFGERPDHGLDDAVHPRAGDELVIAVVTAECLDER